jgi:competence protein ComFC
LIKFNSPPFCVKCSRHLPSSHTHPYCRDCQKFPVTFDFAWSALSYCQPLKKLIRDFKYNQKTLLRHFFVKMMLQFIHVHNLDIHQFDLIIPIPLYSTRFRERGYNQSAYLAEGLSRTYNIKLNTNILGRQKHTKPQSLLDQKERWTNIQGAFTIKKPSLLRNKNILLIDDLMTTGATASQAAQVLKQSKANTVGVFTLAIVY